MTRPAFNLLYGASTLTGIVLCIAILGCKDFWSAVALAVLIVMLLVCRQAVDVRRKPLTREQA